MDSTAPGSKISTNGGAQPVSAAATEAREARDKLMADMKIVISDAEHWLRASGTQTGEDFRAARAKFEATLATAKQDLLRLEDRMIIRTREAARATDDYVHENPWKAVGVGAAVGMIAGLLIARR